MKRAASFALAGATMGALVACEAPVTSVGAYVPDAQARPATGTYLEAEDGMLSGGFTIGSSTAASGGGYIEGPAGASSTDTPGVARALYTVTVTVPDTYLIWGRIHSPDTAHNAMWIQVDGGAWHLWRISTGDVFYWDPVHDDTNYNQPIAFAFDAGAHQVALASAAENVQLDRLYLTADGDVPPGNDDAPCHPPDSIQLSGACVPSCGSQGGTTCGEDVCKGLPAIPVYDCIVCCAVP